MSQELVPTCFWEENKETAPRYSQWPTSQSVCCSTPVSSLAISALCLSKTINCWRSSNFRIPSKYSWVVCVNLQFQRSVGIWHHQSCCWTWWHWPWGEQPSFLEFRIGLVDRYCWAVAQESMSLDLGTVVRQHPGITAWVIFYLLRQTCLRTA